MPHSVYVLSVVASDLASRKSIRQITPSSSTVTATAASWIVAVDGGEFAVQRLQREHDADAYRAI